MVPAERMADVRSSFRAVAQRKLLQKNPHCHNHDGPDPGCQDQCLLAAQSKMLNGDSRGPSYLNVMLFIYRTAAEEMHASVRENQRLSEESRVLRAKLHDSITARANSATKLMSL
jgi:hypothetical protein